MDAFTLVAKLTLNRAEFDHGLKEVETDINSPQKTSTFSAWGVAVGNLAAKAFSRAFSAASGFAKSIIKTGMDFDSMMSEVKAVGGLTEEQFEAVRQKAIDLGASTKFTSKEVGEAFYYMGLAGWKSEEMLSGIEGVLNLAAASGEDLGTVSDIVTDAITAMGLSAEDTARFVNVLAAASTNSNTTVGMMGEAFKYLATTGGVLEYSIEDVATVLGLLANNGIKAGQAGTSMRQILNTLINPTDKAAEAMQSLGLSLFDMSGENGMVGGRKPLMQVVQELRQIFQEADFDLRGKPLAEVQEKIDKLNAEWDEQYESMKKQGASKRELEDAYNKYLEDFKEIVDFNPAFLSKLGDIGGLRGISSLFALMKSTDEDVNQLVDAVNTSSEGQGAAQTMAETMIDNLEGDITLLNSAMDGLKILISDEYKGYIRDFVQMLTGGIGEISAAFSEGGLAGMFTNLTDWIINGLTDTLSNPEITVDGANDFGQALGDFVGHLISKLVSSAPQLISGLFTAGMNLAEGLVNGLFSGLFGTGEGSVTGLILSAEEQEQDAINQANRTATEATGIVNYMDSLVAKYGEAAKESGEWATSLDRLEKLIPGITGQIQAEGQALEDTTESLRGYIAESKNKAIEDAKRATIEKYRKSFSEKQAELGQAQIDQYIAQSMADAAWDSLVELIRQTEGGRNFTGLDQNGNKIDIKQLEHNAYDAARELGIASDTVETWIRTYTKQSEEVKKNEESVRKLTTELDDLRAQLEIAEQAVEKMTADINAHTNSTVQTYGQYANDYYSKHSHAKGDWYIPYDDYPAMLHRGEMVLTASQARRFREGGSGVDIGALTSAIVGAVQEGLRNAQVNSYLDGRNVTDMIAKRMGDQLMLAR